MKAAVFALLLVALHGETIRFEGAEGALPHGWSVAMTHDGAPPKWELIRDASVPRSSLVLAQISRDATAGRFPLAIWDRASLHNGEVSVAFRSVDGKVDR